MPTAAAKPVAGVLPAAAPACAPLLPVAALGARPAVPLLDVLLPGWLPLLGVLARAEGRGLLCPDVGTLLSSWVAGSGCRSLGMARGGPWLGTLVDCSSSSTCTHMESWKKNVCGVVALGQEYSQMCQNHSTASPCILS